LASSKTLAQFNNKRIVEASDVELALRHMRLKGSWREPNTLSNLSEVARQRNMQPLPPIKSFSGISLPSEKYGLTAPNFQTVTAVRLFVNIRFNIYV